VFYLVDESEETGQGANSVISMLHHFMFFLCALHRMIFSFTQANSKSLAG
jgi:hypothetical protein